MPLDGICLGFIARELNERLAGGRVDKVNQPDSDLVILGIRNRGENERLLISASPALTRIHLTRKSYENPKEAPMFCMLLRKHLLGARLMEISQVKGDRFLVLRFQTLDDFGEEGEKQLYLEAMGKHCNLSLVSNGKILDAMRHVSQDMSRVRQLLPGLPFEMPPVQDKLDPLGLEGEGLFTRLLTATGSLRHFLSEHISGISASSARELAFRLSGSEETRLEALDKKALAREMGALFQALPGFGPPVLLHDAQGDCLDALPFHFQSLALELQKSVEDYSLALETLYFEKDRRDRLKQRSSALRRQLKTALEKARRKQAQAEEEALSDEEIELLRVKGELLTSSLHTLGRGAAQVSLMNYYTGETLNIECDESQSPAQNAQRYFKRYRKACVARRLLQEQAAKTRDEIALIEEAFYHLELAQTAGDLSELKQSLADSQLLRAERGQAKTKKSPENPFLCFRMSDGRLAMAGKNARQNERLLKLAKPEDFWFHAKEVPGSHLILEAGNSPPSEQILLEAAKIAAFHSALQGKRVIVDFTKRKYVKKTPGAPEGFVVYTQEKGLLVSAEKEEVDRLRA